MLIRGGVSILSLVIIFLPRSYPPEVFFLDVGQADASLVQQGDFQMLIDTGRNSDILTELKKAMKPLDKRIEVVIITHMDLDHAGGLVSILQEYEVTYIFSTGRRSTSEYYKILSSLIKQKATPYYTLRKGDVIQVKDIFLKVIFPDNDWVLHPHLNETSLVFELRVKDVSFLYTGDISIYVENALDVGKIDVLKVAHHGSKYSSSEEFLARTRPEIAVISSGKNSYGHPTPEVLDRLKSIGAVIYRTDQVGSIRVDP